MCEDHPEGSPHVGAPKKSLGGRGISRREITNMWLAFPTREILGFPKKPGKAATAMLPRLGFPLQIGKGQKYKGRRPLALGYTGPAQFQRMGKGP